MYSGPDRRAGSGPNPEVIAKVTKIETYCEQILEVQKDQEKRIRVVEVFKTRMLTLGTIVTSALTAGLAKVAGLLGG